MKRLISTPSPFSRDESLEDSENLPAPEILAQEIVENLGVALEQFESIVEELENPSNPK